METQQNTKNTPTKFLYFLLILSLSSLTSISAINIKSLLSPYPDLTDFTNLLLSSPVAADLSHRSAVTILAVSNSVIRSSTPPPSPRLTDILRYHILLEFLSPPDLRRIPPAGKIVTTLYQATGHNSGLLNLTLNQKTGIISVSNASVVSIVDSIPSSVTILLIDSLLIPYNPDLVVDSSSDEPPRLNITQALIDGHGFNVAVALLSGSGVVNELESLENGAGITLFIPTDQAFDDLSESLKFQSLPADKKAVVLKFHVLHSYYPLGSLESIVNPVQPTLATEDMGAGSYTLNISRVNGSVAINSGLVQATVSRTVFDENPVAIFGISKVLLPRDIFSSSRVTSMTHMVGAPSPDGSVLPLSSLSPGIGNEVRSEANYYHINRLIVAIFCTGLFLAV